MAMPNNYKDLLLQKIAEKKVNPMCECCGQNNWAVIDQAVSVQVTDLSGTYRVPPPQIPSAGLVCNNCGNIRLFALGALGISFDEGEKK